MRKIGRNEPCPCGSGKKYKKCCGANTIQENNLSFINSELYKVHGNLISDVSGKYNQKIEEYVLKYDSDLLDDDQTKAVYKTGLTPWITISINLLNNQRTIFQDFINNIKSKISLQTRQSLLKWMDATPSIYEVIAVDNPWDNYVKVADISTGENHVIPYQDASDFTVGGLIIGIIVPFKGHDNFLFTMLKLFNDDKEHFKQLLEEHKDYPTLLEKTLEDGLFQNQWLDSSHEEVADLFTSHLAEHKVDNKVIVKAIMLWKQYCKQVNPVIHKPDPHAAAFTYYTERELLNNTQIKQAEIANKFGTSPSTLSNIYRRISKELE